MKSKLPVLLLALFAFKMAFATPPLPPEGYRWVLVPYLSDEFNGTELNQEKWYDYNPWWKGRAPAKFIQETVSVKDGTMQIKNQMLDTPDGDYTIGCGAVLSRSMDNHYGYYECRFKSSFLTMSTTFWLNSHYSPGIPETECEGDNLTTEIDIVETVGAAEKWPAFRTEMGTNSHFHHWNCDGSYNNVFSKGTQTQLSSPCAEEFHTYGAWWQNANYIIPYADDDAGKTIEFRTDILPEPFSQPLTMHMLTETYDWERPPTPEELANDENNTSYYDWVRTYKLLKSDDTLDIPEFSLLVNRDFEEGFLLGWSGWGGNPREIVSDNQHSGNYAGHIVGAGAFEQAVGLKPNTDYILTCWAKVTKGGISFGIKDEDGSLERAKPITNSEYEKYSLEFNSGSMYKGKIFFYASNTSDEGYIDDIEIIEVGYVPLPPDTALALYDENMSLVDLESGVPAADTIIIPYTYQANEDRKIAINVYNAENDVIGDTIINAYAGYANYTLPINLNQQPSIGSGYKIKANFMTIDSTILFSDSTTFEIKQVYQLTINSGTGSGEFIEGTMVDVIANEAPTGQEFNQWTGDIDNLVDAGSASTSIKMSDSDVTITATYKDVPTNTVDGISKEKTILVYPMPIKDSEFILELNDYNNESVSISILDVQGRLIYQDHMNAKASTLSSTIFPFSGIYFLRVTGTKRVEIQKLIVEQ